MLRLTSARLPADSAMQEAAAMPMGLTVQPLAATEVAFSEDGEQDSASLVARCEQCGGYISAYCCIGLHYWRCALCDTYNAFEGQESRIRYTDESSSTLEMTTGVVDLPFREDGRETNGDRANVAFIFALDTCCGEEAFEANKSACLAALEAIPDDALIGLITASVDKIGLVDMKAASEGTPVLCCVPTSSKTSLIAVSPNDVMPISRFLHGCKDCREFFSSLLDVISFDGMESSNDGTPLPSSIISAISAIIRFNGIEDVEAYNSPFSAARLLCFIGCPPRAPLCTRKQSENFYNLLAEEALSSGICVDIFWISKVANLVNDCVHLETLLTLAESTGGSCFQYPSVDESTAPQDAFRLLQRSTAMAGLMRIRCSAEIREARAYGLLWPDPRYPSLYHAPAANESTTFAIDLEFAVAAGFRHNIDAAPVLQLVFEYSSYKSRTGNVEDQEDSKLGLQRRLRIINRKLHQAQRLREVWDTVDADVVVTLLTHKVMRAIRQEGRGEARLLLCDWLIILMSQYHKALNLVDKRNAETVNIDANFSRLAKLQVFPRLVYALLRSVLLNSEDYDENSGIVNDEECYFAYLCKSLPPSLLTRLLYPRMSSWISPEEQAYPRHSLSRAALLTSGAPIFVLDCIISIVVFYSSTAPPDLPYPPAQQSALREEINQLKGSLPLTPRTYFIRGGREDCQPFAKYLIEERCAEETSVTSPCQSAAGYLAFLDTIAEDVRMYIDSK